eukprot:TRINITY_DN15287_c1_g2_i2.p1 TRINITY_DN15287_c1_g2~~TRINITY_DN15287_c1_g2_i2.p1  ORF type:complete len:124 (-),score=1.47 TRINITY_DN15287_c1_g2_i2:5-376(-)
MLALVLTAQMHALVLTAHMHALVLTAHMHTLVLTCSVDRSTYTCSGAHSTDTRSVDKFVYSLNQFKCIIKQRSKDQYVQTYGSSVDDIGVCFIYCMFTNKYCLEKYLLVLPRSLQQPMIKCRL